MNIEIKRLKLNNFKGIKELEIEFAKNTNIYGMNATGKTTVFDAFSWLLFDKDSLNRTDFNIKTLDETGNAIHYLDHSVEATLSVDGVGIALKKIYSEKWTKKRGSTSQEFSGHTTDYYINEVPVKKKDYSDRVNKIIKEDIFKLISNPAQFNSHLDKNKRREVLLGLISEITTEAILEANKDLEDLEPLLKTYSIDELIAMHKAQSRKINSDIKELPVRIDELHNSIKDYDFGELQHEKNATIAEISKIDTQLTSAESIVEIISSKSSKIIELQKKKMDIEYEVEAEHKRLQREANSKIQEAKEKYKKHIKALADSETRIAEHEKEKGFLDAEIADLRKSWIEENGKTYDKGFNCPTCGQDLPGDKVENILSDFNLGKSNTLELIKEKGDSRKKRVEEIEHNLQAFRSLRETLKSDIEKLEAEANAEEIAIEKPELPEEFRELSRQISEIEAELKSLNNPVDLEVKEKKAELQQKLSELDAKLAFKEENENIKAKIDDYRSQEKKLAVEYEKCERILYLCDMFTTTKIELIGDQLNEKFKHVTFKLFDRQVNGGVAETCEALVNGVPYADANNAAKINAGLDVINTLTKFYGVQAPVFVDNAESVNRLIDTDSQLISLIVSEDKELRVENK